jgi:hypothetical protein
VIELAPGPLMGPATHESYTLSHSRDAGFPTCAIVTVAWENLNGSPVSFNMAVEQGGAYSSCGDIRTAYNENYSSPDEARGAFVFTSESPGYAFYIDQPESTILSPDPIRLNINYSTPILGESWALSPAFGLVLEGAALGFFALPAVFIAAAVSQWRWNRSLFSLADREPVPPHEPASDPGTYVWVATHRYPGPAYVAALPISLLLPLGIYLLLLGDSFVAHGLGAVGLGFLVVMTYNWLRSFPRRIGVSASGLRLESKFYTEDVPWDSLRPHPDPPTGQWCRFYVRKSSWGGFGGIRLFFASKDQARGILLGPQAPAGRFPEGWRSWLEAPPPAPSR